MSTRKKLILVAAILVLPLYRLAEFFVVHPIQSWRVGKPAYSKARNVADSYMSKAADGPWEHSNDSFILAFDGTTTGEPVWVFRYHNPKTGQISKRIYVRVPQCTIYLSPVALDALPLHGKLPE